MNPTAAKFKSVPVVLTILKNQLNQTLLADGVTQAFERIELFDNENLVEAFKTLLVSEQRIAVIVPLEARWSHDPKEKVRVMRRVLPVAVLVSDRQIGDRTTALFGNDETPGAFGLSALALPLISGQLISNPGGVVAMPVSESVVILKDQERENLPGRAVVAVEIECQGGTMTATLDVAPTL
ncbi:MAG TPA: hypothetical protein VGO57_02175 [Verrucomicrobiae bacterium]|jgi:hypothetical protein